MTSLPINIIQNTSCRKTKKYVPNLKPYINSLSNYSIENEFETIRLICDVFKLANQVK